MKHKSTFKERCVAVALGIAVMIPMGIGTTVAQEEESLDGKSVEEEVVVTGSRIKRANLTSSSPVTQVDADEFLYMGITRVEDLINDLPQVFASNTSGDSNGATGTATIDLRGLGTERTLVLLNGRRLPAGSSGAGGTAPDLNQLPAGLIERVEVLTGGASSAYGSDAVAGVVNFITKKNFEGLHVDYQHSFYQHKNDNDTFRGVVSNAGFDLPASSVSDGNIDTVSVMFGINSNDGRGNLVGYAEYRQVDAVTQSERDYSACSIAGVPSAYTCGGSGTIPTGTFLVEDEDFTVQGDQFVDRNGLLYNFAPLNYYQRPDERNSFGAMGEYKINDKANAYFEIGFMDDTTLAQIAPSGAFFIDVDVRCNNPLLSAQQRQVICTDFGLAPTDAQTVTVGRRNVEGGPRIDDIRHTAFRTVIGVNGAINDSWDYDAFANFGKVSYSQLFRNDLSDTRIARSLDVVDDGSGNAVCQSTVDGSDSNCVPWNIFQTNGVTQAAIDYLALPLFARGETAQKQISAYVSGDTGLTLPSASDNIKVVIGYEFREEELSYDPDTGFSSGDGAGQGGARPTVAGSYNVKEIFTEANLPLVQNSGIADLISLDLGYRNSSYSNGNSNGTYKLGIEWVINPTFSARASIQHSLREANIRELFRPQSLGLYDRSPEPCSGTTPTATTAQCANSGVTPSQYGNILSSPAGQYNELIGGNPNLEPEESDTVSAGFITSLDDIGLTLSLDYFDIEVKDTIDTLNPITTLDQCLATGDPTFCNLIVRNPSNGSLWIGDGHIIATNVNIAFRHTSGTDLNANYKLTDDLDLNLTATFLTRWNNQDDPAAQTDFCAGNYNNACLSPNPKQRLNLRANWRASDELLVSGSFRYSSNVKDIGSKKADFSSVNYVDIAALWTLTESVQVRGGINNLFDKEPPIGISPADGNGNTYPGVYDALGRYIFAGVSLQY